MDRFWSKVEKTDSCWEWRACRGATGSRKGVPGRKGEGYGLFGINGRNTPAHRVAWMLTRGPIPEGLWVLHHCDNKGCVNPDHLYLGTQHDNTLDAVRRRRMFAGEQTWNHKLREVDIRAIRALAEADFATERIGALFNVSGRTVRYILSGKHWKRTA